MARTGCSPVGSRLPPGGEESRSRRTDLVRYRGGYIAALRSVAFCPRSPSQGIGRWVECSNPGRYSASVLSRGGPKRFIYRNEIERARDHLPLRGTAV